MLILALDVATKTGYAVLRHEPAAMPVLVEYGLVQLAKPVAAHGDYPWRYVHAARALAKDVGELVARVAPDAVVIEETNLGRQRYSQKLLEFLHNALLTELEKYPEARGALTPPVFYVSSSTWRKVLSISMSAEDQKANARLSKAKSAAKRAGKRLDKKALGIRGKITKKHLALRFVNAHYGLELRPKDDDVADAIALGTAFLAGAEPTDDSRGNF